MKLDASGAAVEHTVPIAGIYRLASVDGDAAVLSVTMKGGAWETVTVTVVGKDGAVRWSKSLPAPQREFAEVAGGSGYVAVVLDGCDGELARLTFRGSKAGEWIDTVGDDLTNYSYFAAAAVGMHRAGLGATPLIVGALGLSAGLLASGIEYRYLLALGTGDLTKYPLGFGDDPTGAVEERGVKRLLALARPLFKRDFFVFATMLATALGRHASLVMLGAFITGTLVLVTVAPAFKRALTTLVSETVRLAPSAPFKTLPTLLVPLAACDAEGPSDASELHGLLDAAAYREILLLCSVEGLAPKDAAAGVRGPAEDLTYSWNQLFAAAVAQSVTRATPGGST